MKLFFFFFFHLPLVLWWVVRLSRPCFERRAFFEQFIKLHGLVRRNVIRFLSGISALKMIECGDFVFSFNGCVVFLFCGMRICFTVFSVMRANFVKFFGYIFCCGSVFFVIFWYFPQFRVPREKYVLFSLPRKLLMYVPISKGRVTIFSLHVLLVSTENASNLKMLENSLQNIFHVNTSFFIPRMLFYWQEMFIFDNMSESSLLFFYQCDVFYTFYQLAIEIFHWFLLSWAINFVYYYSYYYINNNSNVWMEEKKTPF